MQNNFGRRPRVYVKIFVFDCNSRKPYKIFQNDHITILFYKILATNSD